MNNDPNQNSKETSQPQTQDQSKNSPTTSLSDYYDMLQRADWTYEMSDDHSVWRRGNAEFGKLRIIARESPAHTKLYDDFQAHMWSDWKRKSDGSPDYNAGRVVDKPAKPLENGFRTGASDGT